MSIVAVTESRSSSGTLTQSETVVVPLAWASIEELSGQEAANFHQVYSKQGYLIEVDYFPGVTITPKHRVKYGARVFDVHEVANWQQRNITLRLRCSEHH